MNNISIFIVVRFSYFILLFILKGYTIEYNVINILMKNHQKIYQILSLKVKFSVFSTNLSNVAAMSNKSCWLSFYKQPKLFCNTDISASLNLNFYWFLFKRLSFETDLCSELFSNLLEIVNLDFLDKPECTPDVFRRSFSFGFI